MLIVALTGGIATGKSVVAKALKKKGCYIHSADSVAHRLMRPGQPAWQKIIDHFGAKILNPDQTINRAKLGEIVFSSPKERQFLNELIHPLVWQKKKEAIGRLEKKGRFKIFVSEAALTVEAGFAPFFDKVVVVTCRPAIQLERLMKRDGINRCQALKKIRSQMPLKEKMKRADYLIDTSGSMAETIAQSEKLFVSLMADYREKKGRGHRKRACLRPKEKRPEAES